MLRRLPRAASRTGAQWPLVALIVFGALSAYFYTAPPFAFKNRGFGDIQVMVSFALAMVFGAFYVQAHTLSWLPVVAALPIGFLVVDILHINNLRDLTTDRAAGITTIAIALGSAGAKRLHQLYVFGAYAVTLVLVAFSLALAVDTHRFRERSGGAQARSRRASSYGEPESTR